MQAQVSCEIIHFLNKIHSKFFQLNFFSFLIISFRNVDNYATADEGISHTRQNAKMPPTKIESERQKKVLRFLKNPSKFEYFLTQFCRA